MGGAGESLLRVGPFELLELLGQGGMGRVYRARHVDVGTEVALKGLVRRDSERAARSLRAEVEAMARLDHPHIARVFDHGVAEEGPLGEGTPWFAMELLRSDFRDEMLAARRWADVAPYVDQLLDALGHAHARGVVHRDLKPSNVMIGRSDDRRPGLKLVDFGIAASRRDSQDQVGTPSAMAPEQWESGLAALGPWTDLFALGVLVWRVVTGGRPTGNAQGPAIYLRMQRGDLEPFEARFPVPDGLEAWLEMLMAFRPAERFGCAADARHALDALRPAAEGEAGPMLVERDTHTFSSHVTVPVARMAATSARSLRPAPPAAPVPERWREELPPPATVHLAGAGLSLLPWREPPLVGRESEREALWTATRRAASTRRPLRLALTGPSGVGASALGRWWVQRLREVSGVLAVEARGGLQVLVDDLLQPLGEPEDRDGRVRGLERWRADFRRTVEALDALAGPADLGLWVGAALELLRGLGRVRPVALFVDSEEPAMRSLVERAGELEAGVMVLIRSASEPPDGFDALSVRPLSDPELSRVLDQLLPVEPSLHRALVEASGGLPARLRSGLLAVVSELVTRPEGFAHPSGVRVVPPAWEALDDLSPEELDLLEVGVAAGSQIHRAVWVRAAGVAPRAVDQVSRQLVRRGIARETPVGLAVDPAVTEALRERARAEGRSARHHGATARALHHLGGDPLVVARCWYEAGEVAMGAAALLRGETRILREHGAVVSMSALEDTVERLRSVTPEVEELHGLAVVRLWLLRQEVGTSVPEAKAIELETWALERGWYEVATRAARLHAWTVTLDQEAMNRVYEKVDRTYLAKAPLHAQVRLLATWNRRLERFADPRRDEVLARIRRLGVLALAEADTTERRQALEHQLASAERDLVRRTGDPNALLAICQTCVELARRSPSPLLCMDLMVLADAHRQLGDMAETETCLEEAERLAQWLRLPGAAAFATGERVSAAVSRGEWVQAANLARRALVGAEHPYLRALLELVCAVPLAETRRFTDVGEVLGRVREQLVRVRPMDAVVQTSLERLVGLCPSGTEAHDRSEALLVSCGVQDA